MRWIRGSCGMIVAIAVICWLLLTQSHTRAQSTVNLQADLFALKAQVSQLRAEVAQIRRQGASQPLPPAARPNPRSPDLTEQQMLDRLAILAIEAKERLNALETRMDRVETAVKR